MHKNDRAIMLATTALCLVLGASGPAFAQNANGASASDDIIVTARRTEERLQDVPISITVLNQEELENLNIQNSSDLSRYVPSLGAVERFGSTGVSFSIRGFTQEQRTPASVGVFFADVVAPRGNATQQTGDGAGPGFLWDLQNVQVLNGPQGTLFGRNTTGGNVLIVPHRPTDEFEGYVQASAGNFDMLGGEGVLNVPISDNLRLRFGVNHQEREGYLENRSGIGPSDFNDLEYTAGRVSAVWDITPNLENYTVFNYVESDTNGGLTRFSGCHAGSTVAAPVPMCNSNLVGPVTAPFPNYPVPIMLNGAGFYDVQSIMPDANQQYETFTLSNATTWDLSDTLTLRNIVGYSELMTELRGNVFGVNTNFGDPTNLGYSISNVRPAPGGHSTDQYTFSEELQLQGRTSDDRFTWQAGVYYEDSDTIDPTGTQTASRLVCFPPYTSSNPATLSCQAPNSPLTSFGAITYDVGTISYQNSAVYAQGTLALTDRLNITAGVRYTWDETDASSNSRTYVDFPAGAPGAPGAGPGLPPPIGNPTTPDGATLCTFGGVGPNCNTANFSTETEAPTMTLSFEYTPVEDVLLYAKYSRGYRQGGINPAAPAGFAIFDAESVNAYELGAKTSFGGPIPGVFNIALFYNDLTNQQTQLGTVQGSRNSTLIWNTNSSIIQGVEISSRLHFTDRLTASIDYTYLDTVLEDAGTLPDLSLSGTLVIPPAEHSDLVFSPHNRLTLGLSYDLPVPENLGEMMFAVTYNYTSESVSNPCWRPPADGVTNTPIEATVGSFQCQGDSYELLDLALNWNSIAGSNVDLSLFGTNVLGEEYVTGYVGTGPVLGFEASFVGAPAMYGARLRYNF